MAMLIADKQEAIMRESPIRKKGRPNNLEESTLYANDTPPRSNHIKQNIQDDVMMTDDDQEEPINWPNFDTPTKNGNDTTTTNISEDPTDPNFDYGQWITKTKKDKRQFPKLTQTKLVDMMSKSGYSQGHNI